MLHDSFYREQDPAKTDGNWRVIQDNFCLMLSAHLFKFGAIVTGKRATSVVLRPELRCAQGRKVSLPRVSAVVLVGGGSRNPRLAKRLLTDCVDVSSTRIPVGDSLCLTRSGTERKKAYGSCTRARQRLRG